MCTAYGWVWSCSVHTVHNTLTALTSAHLWCVSTVETHLVCMSCAGKVHTPMSVWSPHHMDFLTTHTYVFTLHIHVYSMCRVHIGACVVGNWTATCNGTKILTQWSVAHTGQRCLHTPLSMPHASITKTRSPCATADISLHSQFVMCG